MDKLGLAAQNGIGVVIRQTLFGGFYSLLDVDLNPNPVGGYFRRLFWPLSFAFFMF
jgi:hypothetical protein